MMMDTAIDTDGTAFICPECSFNGTSLPELISHLNEAHGEGLFRKITNHFFPILFHSETANKSEAPPKNLSAMSNEKRSRRKPAFSHQVHFRILYFSYSIIFPLFRSFLKHHDNHYLYLNNRMSIRVRFTFGIV
jgi:hypothetical protein